MKKVKLVGVLLAAIIASAPATGYVGNILPFEDNAIVAEAAARSEYTITNYHSAERFKCYSKYTEVMQSPNGRYHLYLMRDGNVTISSKAYTPNNDYNHRYDIWWSDFKFQTYVGIPELIMQGDGNFVVYSLLDKALSHSDTWCRLTTQDVTRNPKCSYVYKLTNYGAFQIIMREGAKTTTVFDSSKSYSTSITKNKMIRAAY
jgi:hypothetical protein